MKKNRKIALILIAILCMAVFAAACGGAKAPTTLEEYLEADESEKDVIAEIAADDPNAEVSVSGNTMEIKYTVEDEVYTKEVLDTALDGLGTQFSEIIQNLQTQTGFDGININVVYVKGDGTEITSKLFE